MRKVIGICGGRIFNDNILRFVNELQKIAVRNNYLTVAFSASTDGGQGREEAEKEGKLFELLRYVDMAALVLLASPESLSNELLIRGIIDVAKEKGIPIFCLDYKAENCYYIRTEYHTGFEQMVRHVVEEHGAKRVYMMAGFKGNEFSEERIRVYRKVLEENGIPFEDYMLEYGDFWERPARVAMHHFLDGGHPLPEAILCANDSMAITACEVLQEYGYSVPEDIIVTGFDGITSGKYHYPSLTTCEPGFTGGAAYIFEELDKINNTGKIEPDEYVIPFMLSKNQSCGCVMADQQDRNQAITRLYSNLGDCTWHTLAMNDMVTNVLDKQSVTEIAELLPIKARLWCKYLRFACVKSEIIKSGSVPEDYGEMETILCGEKEVFETPGRRFDIQNFLPDWESILRDKKEMNILVVNLLHAGNSVYGYTVDGFQELDERSLQRSYEFAMFLSHCINTVLHNRILYEMNRNLSQANEEIAKLSVVDPMTNIYNRRGFFQKLDEMLLKCKNQYLTILSVDMNRLKYINDTFGHEEGDFAIKALANSLEQECGSRAICARFGGDEFIAAMFHETKQEPQQEAVTKRLQTRLSQMEGVLEKPYPITASVGVLERPVDEKLDLEEMIRVADKYMYKQKRQGRKERAEDKINMERWDIYDAEKKPTGRTMVRDDWNMKPGDYHLSVLGVIRRTDGKFLITKRAQHKAWAPGWWEVSGGAVVAGEDSHTAILREIREETGLDVSDCPGELLFTYRRDNLKEKDNYFVDVYRFDKDFTEEDIRLQEEETDGFMIVDYDTIRELGNKGIFLHYESIRQAFKLD